MKCIKARGKQPNQHNVMRCSDQYAKEVTASGECVYTPKRIWKQFVRDNQ